MEVAEFRDKLIQFLNCQMWQDDIEEFYEQLKELHSCARSFEEAGVLTMNDGIVVTLGREEIQMQFNGIYR